MYFGSCRLSYPHGIYKPLDPLDVDTAVCVK